MKTKIILLIAGAAVVTLSFTFATKRTAPKATAIETSSKRASIDGILAEDKF